MKTKPANFIAFDVGSSKIAALAASINKYGDASINCQIMRLSSGFKSGLITDLNAAEESFVAAIYGIESEIEKSVKQVNLAISCSSIKSYYSKQICKISTSTVTKLDVKKLIEKAIAEFNVPAMEIIHYFPLEYILDGDNIVENPVGMYCNELTLQIHIIAANSSRLLNISKCLNRCQVEANGIMAAIYTSSLAVLNEDEKKLGSLVIDFGASNTAFSVFLDNKCIYVGSTNYGGANITADIAKEFSVSLATAEKLKILHGSSDPKLLIKDETIRIEDFEEISSYGNDLTISSAKLSQVIYHRLEQIFNEIDIKFARTNLNDIISRRLVVTGGGANLHGLTNYLSRKFNKQVRVASPKNIPGFVENYNACMMSASMGIVTSESDKYKRSNLHIMEEDKSWLSKTISWLKENI